MDEFDAFDALCEPPPAVDSREWMDTLLKSRCKVPRMWPFQLEHSMDINKKKDVFCVIATGMGKTVLVEQQAEVATARGLRALAINEDTVREAALEKRDLWLELMRGDDVRVAIMTPQMVKSKRMQQLLNSRDFVALVRWVSIDEGQLIEQKDGVFAAGYLSLSILRFKLNSSAVWIVVTATATKARAPVMAKKFGFKPGAYIDARYSTQSQIHPTLLRTRPYRNAEDIVPTVIFAKTIERGFSIMDYLDKLIPSTIPDAGFLIKLYNGLMTSTYRRNLKSDFAAGKVRVMVVTDTAAYGFDVPNVRRVITTDLEDYFEEMEQKFGRAGRDRQPAEMIAFAPSWVRNLAPDTIPSTKAGRDEEEKRAKLREPIRSWFNPVPHFCCRHAALHCNSEACTLQPDCCGPVHDPNASRIDLLRVAEWKEHFSRLQAAEELASTPRLRTDGAFIVLTQHMRTSLSHMIDRWSHQMWARIRTSRELPCSIFFPPFILQAILDKAHLCMDLDNLKTITKGWEYFDECGATLLKFLVETMTGFDAIFDELAESGGSDAGERLKISPDARTLFRLATIPILKAFCRANGCKVSRNKEDLIERLMLYFAR
ncbi:P-loop containing nucleoside triphosphate hydrolase protein [Mycena rosella]|uniref:DNA 3'-5' helicase n=1 Tax=Mycena rosella TaxID=1033263 RepID=A0AAD7DJ94_MYCRO|nr:P-loop containing nucleoside triphosphate hydrolase protein [Mycena rosella]